MKALGISYLKLSPRKYERGSCCLGEFGPSRPGGNCFLFYQKRTRSLVGVSISVGFRQNHKNIHPVSAASSASDTQAAVGNEEVQIPFSDQPKAVRVKFKLLKECAFGQKFLIVGDDSMFGSWDPSEGVPLNWSDGHIWTAELDVPIGKTVMYKVVLQENTGKISWQPGPDRVLETWDTEKTITVSEHWDSPDLRSVVEEETDLDLDEEPLIESENLSSIAVSDDQRIDSNEENGAGSNGYPYPEDSKLSVHMVAENIAEVLKEQDSSTDDERSYPVFVNSSRQKEEIVVDEGIPVLVPGLIPMPLDEAEESYPDEEDGISVTPTPEPEFRKVDEERVTVLKNQYNLKDDNHVSSSLQTRETIEEKEMIGKSQEYYGRVHLENSALESDVQWGRRTLQKFLATLGFQIS